MFIWVNDFIREGSKIKVHQNLSSEFQKKCYCQVQNSLAGCYRPCYCLVNTEAPKHKLYVSTLREDQQLIKNSLLEVGKSQPPLRRPIVFAILVLASLSPASPSDPKQQDSRSDLLMQTRLRLQP